MFECGAHNVRKPISTATKQFTFKEKQEVKKHQYKFIDLVGDYISFRVQTDKTLERAQEALVALGKSIIREVDEELSLNENLSSNRETSSIFISQIQHLEVENFLGVRDLQVLDFDAMPDGVWYIQGS